MSHELNDTGIILSKPSANAYEVVDMIELPWYGKRYMVEVIFEDADDSIPNQVQVRAFCNPISRRDELLNSLTSHIVDHWKAELEQFGQMPGREAQCLLDRLIGDNTGLTGVVVASMNDEDWCNYVVC